MSLPLEQPSDGIYVDNAATSFPKPPEIEHALVHYMRHIGASAGRGAYPRAVQSGEVLEQTRRVLARLFNIATPERILFTLNASDALNLAIKGIAWKAGDSVVVSAMEHNSVLRPVHALQKRLGIRVIKIAADRWGRIDPNDFKKAMDGSTKLVALVHASNVCGTLQPIAEVGSLARARGIPFLVDAAQTAGAYPIDVEAMKIDLLAFPGHKALLGPLGTGALFIRQGISLEPLREGGTGSVSEEEIQPEFLPDRYEAGSHNALGLAGLKAGAEWIEKVGVESIRAHEALLTQYFLDELQGVPGLTVYGPESAEERVAVIPVRMEGFAPLALSQKLYEMSGLMTRSGLHCAPGAHRAIGTFPVGATRFSFGFFNTREHVSLAAHTLKSLAAALINT